MSSTNIRVVRNSVDASWEQVADILASVGAPRRSSELLAIAFARSLQHAFAFEGTQLVGVGRVVGDGKFCAVLVDLAVAPSYQRRGVGSALVHTLVQGLAGVGLTLTAEPAAAGFFLRRGWRLQGSALSRPEILAATEQDANAVPDTDVKTASDARVAVRRAPILCGEVYWITDESRGVPGYTHPHVVVQSDVFNQSRIPTIVVCALTSNLQRAHEPGNVLLDEGEANLPKRSAVVVSHICVFEKAQLGERIGCVSEARIEQILQGLRFQQNAFLRDA